MCKFSPAGYEETTFACLNACIFLTLPANSLQLRCGEGIIGPWGKLYGKSTSEHEMSNGTFTEVTSKSWFSRIGNAFKGIIFGLILVAVSFPLLFWNEGRAVKRYKTLQEGGGAVISISADSVDPANQGKLVHITGIATTDETITDPVFGVTSQSIKLLRTVEMYQWKQESESTEKKKLGGGTETTTTYTYSKTWSGDIINSGNFKQPQEHENPGQMPYRSEELVAGIVTVGAFTLSPSLVHKINEYTTVSLQSYTLPESLAGRSMVASDTIYRGVDPAVPQVGDIRVTFKEVKPLTISLVANQLNNTFEAYHAKAGGTIELLVSGVRSAEAMFQQAQKSNTILTWLLRGAGYIVMVIGFSLILGPLSVFADVVPIFGTIVGAGTGFIAALIAGLLTFLTVGVAWIFYRPVLGIILIAAASALGFFLFTRLKKTPPASTGSVPPPPPPPPPAGA